MKKLTENLIQQRLKTCTTDLDKVLQINVTGRELEDVSLLKKMTGVEILSLSVNQISSLADFQYCKNLKELYLRNNKINDLNEIVYLKSLPKLELLMLCQNPCTNDPSYRMTIIKNLKNLIELDGISITPEERRQAQKLGKEVTRNDDPLKHIENSIPDGPQIQRTPTHSTQELKSSHENLGHVTAPKPYCETIDEDDTEMSIIAENFKNQCEDTVKRPKPLNKREVKQKPSIPGEVVTCKFCGNEAMPGVKAIPKNYNILSATLNLVRELDYSGLQIINAEVGSRLNAFEVDFIYRPKA